MATGDAEGTRSLALTPTWSVATVLTLFVVVSLVVERSIHRLSHWLHATKRKPLFAALEKMKEELMLLGFISLMLAATSSSVARICIDSKYYSSRFYPCTATEFEASIPQDTEKKRSSARKLLDLIFIDSSSRRFLSYAMGSTCKEGHEPFVSFEGLEQLHRFIFVMAITHVFYSCLTMLLAIVKIYTWRQWENDAHVDTHNNLTEITRTLTLRRQSTFVKYHTSSAWNKNKFLIWVVCFFRQFGESVTRADYLTLRIGFITNHRLAFRYDFHCYMIRSMEDEFKEIVGISAPLWGFVIAFMLFNVNGSNLYFWISFVPIILVLLVGAKLQHIIATLALENAGVTGSLIGEKVNPRDELFWFNKPELLLSLIHFILFQNAFELASFFWFWWQFGYDSCFINRHMVVYIRLILGFAGQFLCSYSTLPLYALVTQMGTNFKAALIPPRIRESIHGWGKAARKRRKRGTVTEGSTVRSVDGSTIGSSEDDHRASHKEGYKSTPRNGRDHNQNDYYVINDLVEIEMEMEMEGLPVIPNKDPNLGNIPRNWRSTSLPSRTLEDGHAVNNLLRSLTQTQSR